MLQEDQEPRGSVDQQGIWHPEAAENKAIFRTFDASRTWHWHSAGGHPFPRTVAIHRGAKHA